MTTESSGPYLTAAVLCERVLQEKDEVISIIRMIDRLTVTVNAAGSPETMPPAAVNFTALIALKSGSARGRMTVKWSTETPFRFKTARSVVPGLF